MLKFSIIFIFVGANLLRIRLEEIRFTYFLRYCINNRPPTLEQYFYRLRYIATLLAVLLFTTNLSGKRIFIYGTITNERGEGIELATIHESYTLSSTIANFRGEYSLSVNYRDTLLFTYRMVGHEMKRYPLHHPADTVRIDIMLPSSGYTLQDVTVADVRRESDGMKSIKSQGIRFTPTTNGAVESIITTQAGVSSHNELSNQYSVRGGNFDENGLYVNGVEVMRPQLIRTGEQEGLSFINPYMIESISFSTGGFGVMYGDRMSSVLDIQYQKPQQLQYAVSGSLLGGTAYFGAGNREFSIATSIRYKQNSYLLNSLDTRGEYNPSFSDYQAYLSWRPNNQWEIDLLTNIATNRYQFTPSTRKTSFGTAENVMNFNVYFDGWERDNYRTLFGAANVKYSLSTKSNIGINLTLFNSIESETFDITSEYWLDNVNQQEFLTIGKSVEHARNFLNSNILSTSLKGEHRIGSHTIKWGTELRKELFNDKMREWERADSAGYTIPTLPNGEIQMKHSISSRNKMNSLRGSIYLQESFKFDSKVGFFNLNLGLRASHWEWNRETIVSPRLTVGLTPAFNDNFTLRLATGIYYQSPQYKEVKRVVHNENIDRIELNRDIKSQRSLQCVLGGDYHFTLLERPFKFTAEAFYKSISNLIPYEIDNVRIIYAGTNSGYGYSAGIDFKLFGEFVPGSDSWITLSLMRSEEYIGHKWQPRPSDMRYNLSLHFTDYFPGTDRWRMTLRGVMSDGLPFSPIANGGERHIFRAKPYRRVDIGMSYRIIQSGNSFVAGDIYSPKRGRLLPNGWIGVEMLNLLNINNICSYYWITDIYNSHYAIPNYLTGRLFNLSLTIELP